MKYTVTTQVFDESIEQVTSVQDDLANTTREISRRVIKMEEEGFIEALTSKGWTPPGAGWISVYDRLPSTKEPVLYCRRKYERWSVGVAYWSVSETWVPGPECLPASSAEGFMYWMPLPPPPES